jgi:TPR repeat protein
LIAVSRDPAAARPIVDKLLATCDGDGHELCSSLASDVIYGRPNLGLTADPERGLAMAERRCDLGDLTGCQVLANTLGEQGLEPVRDLDRARTVADRACRLASWEQYCPCQDKTVPMCRVRAIYSDHQACERDEVGACVRVATSFRDGEGVSRDVPKSAGYLRRGCDAADKAACAALDDVCRDHPELPVDLCQQSLIQDDLFFEAEFQAAAGGDVDMINPDTGAGAAIGPQPPRAVGERPVRGVRERRRPRRHRDPLRDAAGQGHRAAPRRRRLW